MIYATLGFVTSSWLSRLPDVRDALHLQPAEIGLILLIASFGSLVTMPTSGPIVQMVGARLSNRGGALLWAAGILTIALSVGARSVLVLVLGLVLLSAGVGLWGATINIEAGLVQAALRRTIVPQLHALYSIGMVVGAVVGSGLAHVGVGVFAHLVGLGVLSLAVVLSAAGLYLSVDEVACLSGPELPVPASDEPLALEPRGPGAGLTRRAWRERTTVLIALMVMSAGLMEGGASDWLSLSMVDGYRMTTAQGSAVLAFFLASLSLVRIVSPRLERRFQPGPLLRMLLLCAVVGLLLVAFAPTTWLALVGVALWGAGAALGFPTGISALSVDPVMTPARVSVLSTVNYGAALIGPPILGIIADHVGYHRAMAALVVPVLVAVFLTRNVPDRRLPAA
ncbi:MFS transporter [Actinomyces culturomici]|uniref:MFS transporter n=1 Tax=Actinomyces culturomici TaxID=1926276 RepID=UPI001F4700A2|nr:MFS transporter [Actinomyces culturomici]